MFSGLLEIIADIGYLHLAAIWVVVIFAAVMRAFTGFGFALTAVPVFSLFMPPVQAVLLSVLLGLSMNVLTLRTYWGEYPVKAMLPMIGFAVIGTIIGTVVLASVSSSVFQLCIGISVIMASLALTFYRPTPKEEEPGVGLLSITGLASGLLNGAFAIPGPPVIIFAVATEPVPARSRAMLMTFFLFSSVAALLSYTAAGFVNPTSLWLYLFAMPAMYLGDKLGYFLFHRYGTAQYRRVAIVVLFGVGVAIAARALF